MKPLETLEQVEEILTRLMEREEPLVVRLPRQPGRKEQRYAQLLAGEPAIEETTMIPPSAILQARAGHEKITELENDITEIKTQLAELQQAFVRFREQFE